MGRKGPVALVSGAVAGACEICVTMPLDNMKTQMQFQQGKQQNIIQISSHIMKHKGFRGFYYGLPAMLCQVSAKASIRFSAFEQAKHTITKMNGGKESSWINLASGLIAGVTESAILVTPTERLKVLRVDQITNPDPKYRTLSGTAQAVVKEQGVGSLFKGFVPTALRQGSSVALRFFLYHDIKKFVAGEKDATAIQQLGAGFCTGVASTCMNMPLDVAKSRIQRQDSLKPLYSGTFQCLATTFRQEGILALYRGLSARVLKVGCGQAITFTIYDQISSLITRSMGQDDS